MIRSVTRWCVLGVMVCAVPAATASAQLALRPELPAPPSLTTIPATQGELHGVVRDEKGKPVAGAVVSALGSVSVFAVSDGEGRFTFRTLPAGPYFVRVYRQGYVGGRGRVIQVTADARTTTWTLELAHRSSEKTPTVLAAGVGPVESTPAEPSEPEESSDDHGEVAWRMRHAPRSVLKDAETALAETLDDQPSALAGLGRAVGAPARMASALFADVPLNGQINFLATTSVNRPQDLFSTGAGAPRIAYVTLAAPVAAGEWNIRGAVTEGDVASWIVAGSFKRAAAAAHHQYEAGFSYSMQRYLGANPESLAAMRDGSRSVGAMYAYDTWTVNPRVNIAYGGKYASYDYLGDRALMSPRASITVQPFDGDRGTRLRALVSHRETAPGAEEFLPPEFGVWLPPERTFSSLSPGGFVPERLDHLELAAERDLGGQVMLGVRGFRQHVDDQVVTLFGVAMPDGPEANGHYQVASAGNFDVRGWGVSLSRQVLDSVRASIDYTQVAARWNRRGSDMTELRELAPAVLRDNDTARDLTASVETVVAPTATRVFVVYRVNDSFAATDGGPTAASRFNVQVNQALPFLNFTGARLEMLVAIRTLFHDDPLDGSMFDELLVVRAPKRVVGGVTVRF